MISMTILHFLRIDIHIRRCESQRAITSQGFHDASLWHNICYIKIILSVITYQHMSIMQNMMDLYFFSPSNNNSSLHIFCNYYIITYVQYLFNSVYLNSFTIVLTYNRTIIIGTYLSYIKSDTKNNTHHGHIAHDMFKTNIRLLLFIIL